MSWKPTSCILFFSFSLNVTTYSGSDSQWWPDPSNFGGRGGVKQFLSEVVCAEKKTYFYVVVCSVFFLYIQHSSINIIV